VIVANRFLAGTRAVVSFFAGMSEMKFPITLALCAVSALAWNAILVGGGYVLGSNWQNIEVYLSTYSQIVTGIVILVALALTVRYLSRKKRIEGEGQ
jgi:membrane protein DedA with SNARE-associated domain